MFLCQAMGFQSAFRNQGRNGNSLFLRLQRCHDLGGLFGDPNAGRHGGSCLLGLSRGVKNGANPKPHLRNVHYLEWPLIL